MHFNIHSAHVAAKWVAAPVGRCSQQQCSDKVAFLKDATGTLDVENEAGSATANELQNTILVARHVFISEVISTDDWLTRIA
ncbi:hypothetical protein [Novipirellula artificiosorum]|uniref:hypothetical protein n=1 Tax=Novipirellula artificiosorum TaxID=2528016 RepID=UPI001E507E8E|nr:hypothetical protein [Novipirellula artificiosorum]